MSFSLHSSTENLGGGRGSSSVGSNSSSSCSVSLKSLMGEMSRKVSARPWLRNHSKLSRWMAMRSGSWSGSARLANEYRSRVVERAGNGYSSLGANVEDAKARRSHAPRRRWQDERTATRKDNPPKARRQLVRHGRTRVTGGPKDTVQTAVRQEYGAVFMRRLLGADSLRSHNPSHRRA